MVRDFNVAVVFDFDATVAETFEPSPNGFGVTEAYEFAVRSVFGQPALYTYVQNNGLKNRSPREVVIALQEEGFLEHCSTSELTEKLVNFKISCLTSEIGKPLADGMLWPRLTNGFGQFWHHLRSDKGILTAILSSGHRAFIEKVFEVHKLQLPHTMVTDDELRVLPEPLFKPDARLWGYLLAEVCVHRFPNAVYVGDDQIKDGGLAHNANVPFLHFAPLGAQGHGLQGSFANWIDIIPLFTK